MYYTEKNNEIFDFAKQSQKYIYVKNLSIARLKVIRKIWDKA